MNWTIKTNTGINFENDAFAYNKDINPENPNFVEKWSKIRPSHMTEWEWQFELGNLILMWERIEIKDRTNLILGWKLKNDLLPKE